MRGRKPTPTEIKLARGNPGRRPVNPHEPKHDPIDPTCPDELTDPRARAEWARIIGALVSRAHVTTVDRAMLMLYCDQYAQWLRFREEATAAVPAAQRSAIVLVHKAAVLMRMAAVELGLTPSSRSRVVAGPAQDEGDVFAQHQHAKPRLTRVK